MSLSFEEFALELPKWHERYRLDKYYSGALKLESSIKDKTRLVGHLDVEDLVDIARWGGNQRGIAQRMKAQNSELHVRDVTAEAIQNLHNPETALRTLLDGISQWGLTYASKTLRFIRPEDFGALDTVIRRCVGKNLLGRINDGHLNSMINGYGCFLELCKGIQNRVLLGNPYRPGGTWYIADIEVCIFQFGRAGGTIHEIGDR